MTPREIYDAIMALTPIELRELRRLLASDDEGGAGVREPRRPILPLRDDRTRAGPLE